MTLNLLQEKYKYNQIAELISDAISKENLKPGDRIQSTRELAANLNTSIRSVQGGLDILEKDGVINRVPRSGVFVSEQSAKGSGNIKILVPVADLSVTPARVQSEYLQYQHGIISSIAANSSISMEMIPVSKSNQYGDINDDALKLIKNNDKVIVDGSWFIPVMDDLLKKNCEVVYFDDSYLTPKVARIVSNWHCLYYSRADAFDKIIMHLKQQGYKKIVLCKPFNEAENKHPLQYSIPKCLKASLQKNGLEYSENSYTPFMVGQSNVRAENIRKYIRELWKKIKFDAIITYYIEDMTDVIDVLTKELGLSVPGDIGIVNWENYPEIEYLSPVVTALRIPSFEMGKTAADIMLSDLMQPTTTILPTELIVRKSTERKA